MAGFAECLKKLSLPQRHMKSELFFAKQIGVKEINWLKRKKLTNNLDYGPDCVYEYNLKYLAGKINRMRKELLKRGLGVISDRRTNVSTRVHPKDIRVNVCGIDRQIDPSSSYLKLKTSD